jgi:CRP-like cAMP-binding protein
MTPDERLSATTHLGSLLADYDLTLRMPLVDCGELVSPVAASAVVSPAECALLNCAPFAELPSLVRQAIAAELEKVILAEGQPLIVQGSPGTGLWIIADGCIDVSVARDNEPPMPINAVGPGGVLGEMSLLTRQAATATAIARGPALAYRLTVERFQRLAATFPILGRVLTQVIATRLGGADVDVLAGKVLNQYRIRGRLGRGGMSVVYDANRMEDGVRAALKMMSHRLVYDPRALEAFQREAELIATFDHPHIVRLLGRFESFHTHFIAMEYCDGEDLKSLIARRGALPLEEVREILGQLAQALDYTHRAGVVHRDIKPSNVMRLQSGRVLLMDFGLAKAGLESHEEGGVIVGTPRYMPPEQFWGFEIDRTADYFSYGCVAYELLTGYPAVSAGSLQTLKEMHENWSVEELLATCPRADQELRHLLEMALQPKPHHRRLDLAAIGRWAATEHERCNVEK